MGSRGNEQGRSVLVAAWNFVEATGKREAIVMVFLREVH